MASWKSYLGMRFSPFLIEDHIGHGGECEVYSVRHTGTGRVLALRLPAIEERLWEAEPVCPPINSKLERRAAINAFVLSSDPKLYRTQPEVGPVPAGLVPRYAGAVHYYGIRDGCYLVPLSAPYRVKGAVDIEEILDRTPAMVIARSEFFEDLVLGLGVGLLNERAAGKPQDDNWLPWILADPAIRDPVTTVLRNMGAHVSKAVIAAALERLNQDTRPVVALESNLLIRLCVLTWSGSLPEEAGEATAKCEHFRNNITLSDISQFVACCMVQSEGVALGRGARYRMPLLAALREQPIYPHSKPEAFAPCVPPELLGNPDAHFDAYYRQERFSLFLMEKIGRGYFLDLNSERLSQNVSLSV
jgi:hypothetical protein